MINNDQSTLLLYCCKDIGQEVILLPLNNWVIQELLFVNLAKTQYTRDDEGPYSHINLDQHR